MFQKRPLLFSPSVYWHPYKKLFFESRTLIHFVFFFSILHGLMTTCTHALLSINLFTHATVITPRDPS